MKVEVSSLDNETIVIQIEHGDTGEIVDYMDQNKNGFAIMGEAVDIPMAVIDGRLLSEDWFTRDHLLAIEAHELGHIRTGSADEVTAELEGIRLLEANDRVTAATILKERGVV